MSKLIIYRASAGSGKTYTLAREYIRLLLQNADNYRRILAVTFTNKATEEMKSRIVRDLHRLAIRYDEAYSKDIARFAEISENELPEKALTALANLLHDYSHFSVVTIDSFFQRVIRSFAREMGLFAGYDVELDQDTVLDEATKLMLADLDENEFLKDWLVEWAKRKIEEGKSWNFTTDLLHLGSEIFSEELQNMEPDLLQKATDKKELERYRENLQQLVNDYRDDLQRFAQKAISIIKRHGLDIDSFTQKQRGVGGYFLKLSQRWDTSANSYVIKALDGVEEWYSKKSPQKNAIMDAHQNGLDEILQKMVGYQNDHAQEIATAKIILKQVNVLGVLCDLMDYVKEYARDQNLFLISEASGFLKTIIANADAPFIYERVGNFYNHFMIDEFQDTSSIQWDNFRPLIANSIASGYQDWIVGDVKQSIYRWRNADWKILSEHIEHDTEIQNVEVEKLNQNWRSAPETVQFNNSFFREAVSQLCAVFANDEEIIADEDFLRTQEELMRNAYRDCYQHLPEQKTGEKGYVRITIIPEEEDAEKTWQEIVLDKLPRQIEKLQDLGYGLSDIAILVRENREARDIADFLLAYRQSHLGSKYRYDVLSNESLLIGHSPVVKWLLAMMRYIIEPDDKLNRAFLNSKIQEFEDLKIQEFENSKIKSSNFGIIKSLNLRSLPVYELSEKIIQQYNLYQIAGQAPFLQAFQDILLQYTRRQATDVRSFLDWWEGEKDRKCVAMPDHQDAIRLMTIHKSKGLEFDAVIIPFCDWQLCKSGKTLWCKPDVTPFSDMKILPLKFEPPLRDTIFVNDWLHEKMMSYIDNLNLLYVAFTRAKKALFISTPQQKKEGFANVKDLIQNVLQKPFTTTRLSQKNTDNADNADLHGYDDYWQPENLCFELGELTEKASKKEENPVEYFDASIRCTMDDASHIARNSAYYVSDDRLKGRLLHDIFRYIVTADDLERCLNTMIAEGKLSEKERSHIVDTVHSALGNPIVSRWFTPEVQVKTEAEILLPDGSFARPDRIVFDDEQVQVIDYKFGELQSEKYRLQVMRYTDYLRGMGYASVKGYLWYVTLNKVEEVY